LHFHRLATCCLSLASLIICPSAANADEQPVLTGVHDAAQIESEDEFNWEVDWGDEDEKEETGRGFLYLDVVLSMLYTADGRAGVPRGDPSEDPFEMSPRPPGNYAGIDYVRTFTPYSAINRALPRWLPVTGVNLHPRIVVDRLQNGDGTDRLAFAPQDFWVRFSPGGRDRLSLRIGQFVIPYGVNPIMAPRHRHTLPVEALDLGLKWDWGVGLKGPLGEHDWELAATIGSGEALHSPHLFSDGPTSFLLTGRFGTPTYWDLQYGASFLYGDLPMTRGPARIDDQPISRWRIGLDAFLKHGTYLMAGGQLTYGQDGLGEDAARMMLTGGETANVLGYRAWLDWVVPALLDLRLGAQIDSVIRDLSTDYSDDTALTVELTYSLTTSLSVILGHRHEFNQTMGGKHDSTFLTFVLYGL